MVYLNGAFFFVEWSTKTIYSLSISGGELKPLKERIQDLHYYFGRCLRVFKDNFLVLVETGQIVILELGGNHQKIREKNFEVKGLINIDIYDETKMALLTEDRRIILIEVEISDDNILFKVLGGSREEVHEESEGYSMNKEYGMNIVATENSKYAVVSNNTHEGLFPRSSSISVFEIENNIPVVKCSLDFKGDKGLKLNLFWDVKIVKYLKNGSFYLLALPWDRSMPFLTFFFNSDEETLSLVADLVVGFEHHYIYQIKQSQTGKLTMIDNNGTCFEVNCM